jgi:hypothetical protein
MLFHVIECCNCSDAYCKLDDACYIDRILHALVVGVVPPAQDGHGDYHLVVEGTTAPGI